MATTKQPTRPEASGFEFSKPIPLRWWRLPKGNFVGNASNLEMVQIEPATRVDDGAGMSGIVDSIALHPNGVVVVALRCGITSTKPEGVLRHLFFGPGGQGVPL